MSHINVTINGRQYRMACEEGQEARLLKLADDLESRIQSLRGKFGEIGDARLTVMAALTACDEMLDAGQRIRNLEQELEALRSVRLAAVDRARATQLR
jgi:cell division protein ZapA